MHEIAIATPITRPLLVLSTRRLFEVRHRTKLHLYRLAGIVPPLQPFDGLGSCLLVPEFHVHIPDHMIRDVVAHAEVLHLSVFVELEEQILVKVLEKLLHTLRVDGQRQTVRPQRRI